METKISDILEKLVYLEFVEEVWEERADDFRSATPTRYCLLNAQWCQELRSDLLSMLDRHYYAMPKMRTFA